MQSSPRIDELRQKFHENPRRYFAPLANEYRKAGDPEQAIAICRAHLAQQPGHMSGHVVYGQALYDAGRIDEANTVFRQALTLDPENMVVLRHLGDIARQRGEIEEARSWYSRALDGDPQDTEVAAYLAELTEPLVMSEPETAPSSMAATPEPEIPAEQPVEEPVAEASEPPVAEVAQEPVAEVADTSFDSTFDELIVDEGISDAPREGVPLDDESPYLDEMPPIFEESSAPLEETPAPAEETTATLDEAPPILDEAPPILEEAPPILVEPRAVEELTQAAAASSEEEDLSARSTPAFESSPIITRTLAELYLEQGYIEPALEIYRQLAEREPHDEALQARITELSGDAEEIAPGSEEEFAETAVQEADTAVPSAESWAQGAESGAQDAERGEPSAEVNELEELAGVSEPMTDMWDAPDSWGSDMFEDITDGGDTFGLTSSVAEELDPPESLEEAIAQADEAITSEPEPEQRYEMEQPQMESPRGITIREFFATLGSMHPPTVNGEDAFTPEESAPAATEPEPDTQYPYADDAFASLFQDAPVSPEDSRAAAALSSAVAHNPPPSISTPTESRSVQDEGDRGREQTMQESEEDIRRFREWLDGLANS